MPTAKVTKNVSAATGGGNVLCSTLISIKTKAWLYSFRRRSWDKAHRRQAAFHSDNGNRLLHGRFPIRVWLIMLSFILFPALKN